MAGVVNNDKSDRSDKSVDAEAAPIPFIDFLLCCYVYIDTRGIDANNKRRIETANGPKHGR